MKGVIENVESIEELENLEQFRPNVAILTNISEAHTDFMKTYEHYTEVKRKLFKNQDKHDVAILNLGNDESIRITKGISSSVKYFTSKGEINGAYIKDGAIYYYDELVVRLKDIRLIGMHNYENIMAAIMAVKEYQVSNQAIQEVLKEFNGVEHRLEFVAEVAGRKFYNDTEATNIKCCQIALSSFQEPVILFLGGLERGQDFTELKDYMAPVKAILAIGECRERVKQFGEQLGISTYEFEFLKDAMPKAWEISTNGDIILLSPASASWDQYKQCEDRGAEFKAFVHSLQKNN